MKIAHDIFADILRRLPVKSVLRFRCLSKTIYYIVDDPDFVRRHLTHSLATKSNHGLILRDWNLFTVNFDSLSIADEFNYHPLHAGGGTEVVGSVNGLIAMRHSERSLCIYNIATRKFKRLPVSEIKPPSRSLDKGYVFYGFGYDSVRDDYKLLRMGSFVGEDFSGFGILDHDLDVSVYSLRADSWKKFENAPSYLRFLYKPFHHVLHRRGYGVFACCALHWVIPQRPEFGLKNFVVCFDLQEETFREVFQPDYTIKRDDFQLDVGSLGGCLCLMCNYQQEFVDVWVMVEFGVKESWTRVLTISTMKMTGSLAFVKPLVYSKDEERLLLEVNNQKLIWYDWKRRRAERVRIRDAPNSFGVEMYVWSLVPVGDCGCETREMEMHVQEDEMHDKIRDDFLSVGFNLKL